MVRLNNISFETLNGNDIEMNFTENRIKYFMILLLLFYNKLLHYLYRFTQMWTSILV